MTQKRWLYILGTGFGLAVLYIVAEKMGWMAQIKAKYNEWMTPATTTPALNGPFHTLS